MANSFKAVVANAVKAWEKAKKTLQGRNAWIQDREASDKKGKFVNPRSKTAVQFCASGALNRATRSDNVFWKARELFIKANGQTPIGYNDTPGRTKTEVVSAIAKAIKLGKQELKNA